MARWLLGEEPVEVYARGAVLVDPRVRTEGNDIDTRCCCCAPRPGKMCQISNTRRAVYGYDQRIEVFGSKGMLRAGQRYADYGRALGRRFDRAATIPWPNFQTRYAAAYAAELSSFINSVERRKPSEVPPEGQPPRAAALRGGEEIATSGQPVKVSKN
jgi:myo-inositol 2-dehydrogenase/D-chiro-inositol 1-dehydrogenase